jgi:hypothetical protein
MSFEPEKRSLLVELPPQIADRLRRYCAMHGDADPAAVIEAAIRKVAEECPMQPVGKKVDRQLRVIEGGRR